MVLLRLMQLVQDARGEPIPKVDPLVKLNHIVTDRINTLLQDDRNQSSQSSNEEFLDKYKRLELAVDLPLDKLDKKIAAYNEYRLPAEQYLRQTDESSFDKRVTKLLEKLGVYSAANNVLNTILNDKSKLRELQKRLKELDNETNKNQCCCEWDIIFTLF